MSEQEFLALPDREKDALVAEKVMGWHRAEHQGLQRVAWKHPALLNSNGFDWCDEVPRYSISIEAAWVVVESLCKYNPFWEKENAHIFFQLTGVESQNLGAGFCCNFGDGDSGMIARTAPLAICLAALKANGVIE